MKTLNYFKALADITRIRIINVLCHYELGVNEIVALMQMGQSRISRHLKILADADLLQCRRDGVWAFYSATEKGAGYQFIHSIRYLFESDDAFKQDIEQAKHIVASRKADTMRFFNTIAGEWDRLKKEVLGKFDLNREILNHIEACQIAVDLGCGTGECLVALAQSAENVIGVDSSIKMLELSRRRFKDQDRIADLRLGELEHLPLKDEEADCAVMSLVLHHLSNPQDAIGEVYRILRPQGIYIVIDFLKHGNEMMRKDYGDRWLGFSQDEMNNWLTRQNFSIRHLENFRLNRTLRLQLYKAIKN